ncbi:hypothetical protein [Streptomyces fructofermentans]|uniref:Uncharacterized protein n=1 Tax=Streptomyces fructofermentans TaxID=152141 RepID=A0A918KTW6_9ACTN|nr:hypothetical protein [Streptomyces fructofermentans]GGX74110.1 hypothetical protein GCM10010515_47200 [Streptomyces fructofermentans]
MTTSERDASGRPAPAEPVRVSMRELLAAGAAARAVSTPPRPPAPPAQEEGRRAA